MNIHQYMCTTEGMVPPCCPCAHGGSFRTIIDGLIYFHVFHAYTCSILPTHPPIQIQWINAYAPQWKWVDNNAHAPQWKWVDNWLLSNQHAHIDSIKQGCMYGYTCILYTNIRSRNNRPTYPLEYSSPTTHWRIQQNTTYAPHWERMDDSPIFSQDAQIGSMRTVMGEWIHFYCRCIYQIYAVDQPTRLHSQI